ncbi:MAG: family 43 glycosylhydrolase [Lachnospiraceae bacterium]|nr:family 43 glycosylhydrolase [Lachnospiraceae bacterium]
MKINVYTRSVNPDNYPEGLARSIHFSCTDGQGQITAFNRDYGILFAKGRISADNTIVPLGIAEPRIFAMDDGFIGIAGKRVFENGEPDPLAEGKLVLWKTKDLIKFGEEELISAEEIEKYDPSEQLDADPEIAKAALIYWSPITYTGISVPENLVIDSACEPEDIRATVSYSDGSVREKKILFDRSGIGLEHPGRYTVTGRVSQQRFRFPLANGYGDPVIFRWEGKWYYISTNDNLNDIGIYVREAEAIDGLFRDGIEEHLILPFDPGRGLEQTFWAPEFHVIGGELYILFAVSGHKWGPQCHMMKKKKDAPIILEDSWEDPVRVLRMDGTPLAEDAITLDMTFVRAKSGSYVIWSYRENIGTALDSGSMLYIATIDEERPWRLTSEPVLLTRPLYGWENVSGTINNEGPYTFVKDDKVYVTYSGGSANRYTYALGLLTADSDADLLDLASWQKSITPVLTFYSVKGEYGPGHNSFFENEEGELMIAYHGETDIDSTLRCDGIRRVHFRKDGTPYFQMSPAEDICDEDVRMIAVLAACGKKEEPGNSGNSDITQAAVYLEEL